MSAHKVAHAAPIVATFGDVKPGDLVGLNRGLTPARSEDAAISWRYVQDVEPLHYGSTRLTIAFTLEPVTMTNRTSTPVAIRRPL